MEYVKIILEITGFIILVILCITAIRVVADLFIP